MQSIIELVKLSNIDTRFLSDLSKKLVRGIRSGRIHSKKDAIKVLFKDRPSGERSYYYLLQRVKHKLLLAAVFSIHSDNEYKRAEATVYGGFAAIKLFAGMTKSNLAIRECLKVLPIAEKYEFITVAYEISTMLLRYYAELGKDEKQQRKFSHLANHYSKIITAKTKALQLYTKAIRALNNRSSYTPSVIDLLDTSGKELSESLYTADIVFQYYTLKVIHCFAVQDYPKGARVCQEALRELNDKPAAKISHRVRFLLYRGVCATAGKNHEAAENSFLEALKLSEKHEYNKQVITYYRAINAMHQGKYFKAQYLRDEARREKRNPVLMEYWAIVSAYLYFFNGGKKFKLGKFFNETLDASKDKDGQNINILICELIISITDRRDRFLHRIEAVQNYVYRHLKGKQTERARIFLELLFQVPKSDFYPRRIKQNTYRKQAMLKRRSVYANHNLEIEIVPFEVIWEKILDRLERRETIRATG